MELNPGNDTTQLTADIVSAYVARNKVEPVQLTKLIEEVYSALVRAPAAAAEPKREPPAVAIKESVTLDYIFCLEDGLKFKSLKRHLTGSHGTTPSDYRAKWGLPRDYPMVASSYSEWRSTLAKSMGLGRKSKKASVKKASPAGRRKRPAK